jgi:hypothetical protein
MANVSFIESGRLISLIRKADPNGKLKCVIRDGRLALGSDPFNPEWFVDLSTEAVEGFNRPPATDEKSGEEKTPVSRRSGSYAVELRGRKISSTSLKLLLRDALVAIESTSPGTLEKLSHIKPYSKRIVARDPSLLFESSHLSDEFSEKLVHEWWFGTNNSAQEVRAWLERAATCAGLTWGRDLKVMA